MTDPNVYPITAAFEKFCEEEMNEFFSQRSEQLNPNRFERRQALAAYANMMGNTLGEYEHGTAEADDLLPDEVKVCLAQKFPMDRETITHGLNAQCPEVQSGKWKSCQGHPTTTVNDLALKTIKNIYEDLFLVIVGSQQR